MLIKCKECGKEFSDMADACPNCGYNPERAKEKAMGLKPKAERKSKNVALLLTFFLWWVGGEFFYLGRPLIGFIIAINMFVFFWLAFPPILFIIAICELVHFIMIALMSDEEFDRTYNCIQKPSQDNAPNLNSEDMEPEQTPSITKEDIIHSLTEIKTNNQVNFILLKNKLHSAEKASEMLVFLQQQGFIQNSTDGTTWEIDMSEIDEYLAHNVSLDEAEEGNEADEAPNAAGADNLQQTEDEGKNRE